MGLEDQRGCNSGKMLYYRMLCLELFDCESISAMHYR